MEFQSAINIHECAYDGSHFYELLWLKAIFNRQRPPRITALAYWHFSDMPTHQPNVSYWG
jgi:hypothetical protein